MSDDNTYRIQYVYPGHGAYPGGSKILNMDDNEGKLSRHHIIPYNYMYAFGIVLLSYLYIVDCSDPEIYAAYKDKIAKKFRIQNMPVHMSNIVKPSSYAGEYNRKKSMLVEFGPEAMSVLNSFSWLDENLFLGPAGKFRSDDPAQEQDFIPAGLRFANDSLICELNSKKAIFTDKKIASIAGKSVQLFMNEAQIRLIGEAYLNKRFTLKDPYDTKVGEWAVHCDGTKDRDIYYNFYIEPQRSRNIGKKRLFKICLLNKKTFPGASMSGENKRNRKNKGNMTLSSSIVKITGLKIDGNNSYLIGMTEEKRSSVFEEQQNKSVSELINRLA